MSPADLKKFWLPNPLRYILYYWTVQDQRYSSEIISLEVRNLAFKETFGYGNFWSLKF